MRTKQTESRASIETAIRVALVCTGSRQAGGDAGSLALALLRSDRPDGPPPAANDGTPPALVPAARAAA
jgi:hypothetical protein